MLVEQDQELGWEDDEAIYARFFSPLYQFLWNKLPSNANGEIDDLLQETFVRFMDKRKKGALVDKQGRSYSTPGALLYGMANNLLREHVRRVAKAKNIDEIGELSIADISVGVSSQAALAERKLVIHELLRELPFNQQTAIECHYFAKMSYKAISEVLDVPLGTVATWCRLGRARLKSRLEQVYAGKPVPQAFTEDEAARRPEALADYPWYDPATGDTDHRMLIATVTRRRCGPDAGALPEWFAKHRIPRQLPHASASELSQIAYGVWGAWDEAGRPGARA